MNSLGFHTTVVGRNFEAQPAKKNIQTSVQTGRYFIVGTMPPMIGGPWRLSKQILVYTRV